MKFKLLALAGLMAAAAPSFAAIADATSGNGELMLNLRSYVGSVTTGNNDMSAVFDLGVSMNTALSWNGLSGFTKTWNLRDANYGNAWNDIFANALANNNSTNIEFNVIALDNTQANPLALAAGDNRYLTTATVNTFTTLANTNLSGFQDMNAYVLANNSLGTNAQTNGASTAVSGDSSGAYFGAVSGSKAGDSWATKTSVDTTSRLSVAQNFYYLTNSDDQATNPAKATVFGVDVNSDGIIQISEYSKWTVNAAAGTVSFTNLTVTPVPEPESYAMLLVGLGLMGAIIRRRKSV